MSSPFDSSRRLLKGIAGKKSGINSQGSAPWTPADWHNRFETQAAWTANVRRYLYQQIGLGKFHAILEVGSGTGVITRDLHNHTPARIFGVDHDFRRLQYSTRVDCPTQYIQGDALALPFMSGFFDITLCHYLLLWLADPSQSLVEMSRVTRRGGYVIALAEPDHDARIDFPPTLEELGQLQTMALRKQGAHTHIGRSLAGLLHQAGLIEIQTGLLGGNWSTGVPDSWQSEWQTLENDLAGYLPASELASLRLLDNTAWQNGERILFIPTFYAWGIVPENDPLSK